MGQTLTHGIYLPDEGERNCYNGLAANWQLLDGAVGTVAEHTSQIAGKAPLVHTHTKADITDLFNSVNTWTGENKYTSGFILSNISWSGVTPPSSTKPTVIEFKNSDTRQGRYINRISSTSSETWIETIRNVDANTSYNHTVILKVDNSGNKSVYPSSNNDVDLGTSTNKWKSFNGINPGALSLPDQDANSVNLSGNITVLDGSASNDLTQTVNGWLFIYIENTTGAYIRAYIGSSSSTRTIIRGVVDAERSQIYIFAPIFANITVSVYVKATSIGRARFYPCLGNV